MKQLGFDDAAPPGPKVWTVSEIVTAASQALEQGFGNVWVEGEISNLNLHRSGHVYMKLKDAQAVLSAVLWQSSARKLKFRLENGQLVRCHGRLSIYADRGDFQIYVDRVEPRGLGELQLAFEQLKDKLAAEGLFEAARKQPLPFLPRVVGLVTSPSGAAVRDFIRVATRRFPARILIAPSAVQGEGAPAEIVRALGWLDARDDVEVIVLARGGGSIEDLWAFNDEGVARAIAACGKPVVSAIGHEVDFTIADFVADVRAPTPSAAAEMVVPEHAEMDAKLEVVRQRLRRASVNALDRARQRLDGAFVAQASAVRLLVARRRQRLTVLRSRLAGFHPRERLRGDRRSLAELSVRLGAAGARAVAVRRDRFGTLAGKLHALSPLGVLDRGYAVARGADGRVLTDAARVAPGDRIDVRLARGRIGARVESSGGEE